MVKCKKYKKHLVLDVFRELDEYEKADLEAHLHICESCRQERNELLQIHELAGSVPDMPDENSLKILRNVVHARLQKHAGRAASARLTWPRPIIQFALIVLFIGIGYFAGLQRGDNTAPGLSQQDLIKHLISAENQVYAQNSEISPYLMEINRLKYNAETGEVSINYNTVNDIRLSSTTGDPLVQDLLLYAMQNNENPNVRMQAVKAVNALANQEQELSEPFIKSLESILEKEENPGIRLFALRVLEAMPMNQVIKNSLVHVLLFDPNSAMRIEALNILTKEKSIVSDITSFLETAKQDSNEYIRSRSSNIIEQLNEEAPTANGPFELARRKQP